MNNQLILKTTPTSLAEIKQLLSTIDRPLRRLLISVQQGNELSESNQNSSVSGSVGSDNARITRQPDRESNRGLVIESGDSTGNVIQFNSRNTQTSQNQNNTYTLQTLEGKPAYIQTGQSVPVPSQNTVITRNGVILQNTTEYASASSGFYVLPRVNGNTVTLQVAPRLSSVSQGRMPEFNVQNVETTVSGQLGDWMQIGGLNQSGQGDSSRISGAGQQMFTEQHSVLIKVEEIR